MDNRTTPHRISRRGFLKAGGLAALALAGSQVVPVLAGKRGGKQYIASPTLPELIQAPAAPPVYMRLAATDGHISLPGRRNQDELLFVFGFVEVPLNATIQELDVYKGNVQAPSPLIGVDQETDLFLTVTNIGLVVRPDLDDSHTIHWHGFRNPIALFDGVPEVSIAVPPGRDFPYFFRPHDPGTYMYHCHFEDSEHVQMGMTGIVYVRPIQNGNTSLYPSGKYVYNDGDGSTGYDREFALMLNEIDTRPHDLLAAVQEFIWSNYKPNYWIINGRSYPDTILPNNDPSLPSQPISSLIQVNAGERALLRFASLGYEQHALQLPGIPMRVVGEDATLLRGQGGVDLSYFTNTIYIGPGEARDVIFTAPAHSGSGAYDTYLLKNRSPHKLTNGGAPGLGGMVTEVRVYPAGTLPPQSAPNETYP